jgi:hypothetical protein
VSLHYHHTINLHLKKGYLYGCPKKKIRNLQSQYEKIRNNMTPEERQTRAESFGFTSPTHALRAIKKYLGMIKSSLDNTTDQELEIASTRSRLRK